MLAGFLSIYMLSSFFSKIWDWIDIATMCFVRQMGLGGHCRPQNGSQISFKMFFWPFINCLKKAAKKFCVGFFASIFFSFLLIHVKSNLSFLTWFFIVFITGENCQEYSLNSDNDYSHTLTFSVVATTLFLNLSVLILQCYH